MNLHTEWRWGRLLAGAVLPLLVIVLAAPSAVRASCGDYVVIGSKSSGGASRAGDHLGMPSGGAPRPCSGPLCNRGTPVPVPATITPAQPEHWICLPRDVLPDDPRRVALLRDEPRASPESHDLSIYHPPRLHPF
jgi:hypothetical protein